MIWAVALSTLDLSTKSLILVFQFCIRSFHTSDNTYNLFRNVRELYLKIKNIFFKNKQDSTKIDFVENQRLPSLISLSLLNIPPHGLLQQTRVRSLDFLCPLPGYV